MKFSYYPGCTLKNHARNFDSSTLSSMAALGLEVEELGRWNCCGTVHSLTSDDLMRRLAPVRNLIRVKEEGADALVTTCAMCYNTVKRANEFVRSHPQSLTRMNEFMHSDEPDYEGDVDVLHLLEIVRDRIGFEALAERVGKPLEGLRVASYYGCMLVRPREAALDNNDNPTVLDDLVTALGGEAIDFSFKAECCASFLTVERPDIVADRTYRIITAARTQGAEMISVSCPLCAFNLDQRQVETLRQFPDFRHLPVVYFTQLLALALGCPETELGSGLHHIDPRPVLESRGLL